MALKSIMSMSNVINFIFMKRLLFLSSLIFIPFFACSQPKIDKITWVGKNNEYLNISKKKASLQKESDFQKFDVVKYVKNSYIVPLRKPHFFLQCMVSRWSSVQSFGRILQGFTIKSCIVLKIRYFSWLRGTVFQKSLLFFSFFRWNAALCYEFHWWVFVQVLIEGRIFVSFDESF
jgi:hypothetical protein